MIFYSSEDVTIYHGDAREILPSLRGIDAVVTDPPYGIGYVVNARKYSNEGLRGLRPMSVEKGAMISGDDRPFDAGFLLGFAKVAIFGANHYTNLPIGGKWIVWDKRCESEPDDHSDCEFVWTNTPGSDRIHRQKWRGIVRVGEENLARSRKLHPNQKPVALITFVFSELRVITGETVCDPFMGSGSTGVVAVRNGNRFIGIDIIERNCEVAARRLSREPRAPFRFRY